LLPKLPEPQVPFGLDLTKLPLTDRWLVDLRGLKNLQALNLAGKEVTDAGRKELAGLKNLRWVDLTGTKVTDAGVEELRKALPTCDIERSLEHIPKRCIERTTNRR
jgi:internalin A